MPFIVSFQLIWRYCHRIFTVWNILLIIEYFFGSIVKRDVSSKDIFFCHTQWVIVSLKHYDRCRQLFQKFAHFEFLGVGITSEFALAQNVIFITNSLFPSDFGENLYMTAILGIYTGHHAWIYHAQSYRLLCALHITVTYP